MTEVKYTYYWCENCGWDSVRNRDDIKGPCPLCAEDTGDDGHMRQRPATEQDKPEGKDDRFAH